MLLFLDSIFLESQEVVVRVRRDMINVLLEAPLIFPLRFGCNTTYARGAWGLVFFRKFGRPKSAEGESF